MTNASIYFLMAAGLRLGVLPLNLPFLDTPELRRGSGILFRLMPAASALVLIAQLQQDFLHFDETFSTIIQVLTIIAAFYSALMWMTRQSTFEAQPYWVVALSAFAVQSALNGHPAPVGFGDWAFAFRKFAFPLQSTHPQDRVLAPPLWSARLHRLALYPCRLWLARLAA